MTRHVWSKIANLFLQQIYKWNMINNETSPLMKLPEDVFPTDMHWFPKSAQGGKKAPGSDVFALGSSDGKQYRSAGSRTPSKMLFIFCCNKSNVLFQESLFWFLDRVALRRASRRIAGRCCALDGVRVGQTCWRLARMESSRSGLAVGCCAQRLLQPVSLPHYLIIQITSSLPNFACVSAIL